LFFSSQKQLFELFHGKPQSEKGLVQKVSSLLKRHGHGKSTLVASSLYSDEPTRPLENDFYMRRMSGFPFGGLTGFGAMPEERQTFFIGLAIAIVGVIISYLSNTRNYQVVRETKIEDR
jgi:hypothetical protein